MTFLVGLGNLPVYVPRLSGLTHHEIPEDWTPEWGIVDSCEVERPRRAEYVIHRCDQHEVAIFWRHVPERCQSVAC